MNAPQELDTRQLSFGGRQSQLAQKRARAVFNQAQAGAWHYQRLRHAQVLIQRRKLREIAHFTRTTDVGCRREKRVLKTRPQQRRGTESQRLLLQQCQQLVLT